MRSHATSYFGSSGQSRTVHRRDYRLGALAGDEAGETAPLGRQLGGPPGVDRL